MNNLINPHDNTERIIDKACIDSCISGSTLYQVEDILNNDSRDTVFDIFNQSLSDTNCYHNFDQFANHSSNSDMNFCENFQTYHINNGDFKSEMKKFLMNKVWPDQLDILAGPLLEDDDDDCYSENNSSNSVSETDKMTDVKAKGETALILNSAMTTGIVQFGIDRKMFHIDNIDYKNDDIQLSNKNTELGRIIKLSRVEDDNEEIDIVTIDDENVKDNFQSCNSLNNNNIQNINNESTINISNNTNSKKIKFSCSSVNDNSLHKSENNNETALVAPDLNSLLEQFEATQETDDSVNEKYRNKDSTRLTSSSDSDFTPKGSSAASVIKRIKSSIAPARSTIMISHETVLNSASPHRLVTSSCTKFQNVFPAKRNLFSSDNIFKDSITDMKKNILSSSDHDYCSTESYYNKIPDYLTELKPIFRIKIKKEETENKDSISENINVTEKDKSISNKSAIEKVTQNKITKNVPSEDNPLSDSIGSSIKSDNPEVNINHTFPSLRKEQENLQIYSKKNKTSLLFEDLPNEVGNQNFEISNSESLDFQLRKYHSCSENNSPNRSPLNYAIPRRSRSRSPSKRRKSRNRERETIIQSFPYHEKSREKMKQLEERRVVYVGNIPKGTTRAQLLERFGKFGPIQEISLHFKEHGESYGFITYYNRSDAYNAIDCGNDDYNLPKYHLSFGGRRQFCKAKYSDLDSQCNFGEQFSYQDQYHANMDFDSLLKVFKAQQNSKFLVTDR